MTQKRFCQIVIGLGLLTVVAGCSGFSDYRLGIVTRSISGEMAANGGAEEIQPFIIVRKHKQTLIETSQGYLYRINVAVVRPHGGRYSVAMEAEVNRIDLIFLGRHRRLITYHFKRTLGISEYIYDVQLQDDPTWRDSYYLLIKPMLTDYVVEQRYELQELDQLFLGEWMDRTEAEFE